MTMKKKFIPQGKPVLGHNQMAQDKLYMLLGLEEQFQAINTPLTTRKGGLQLRYVDHWPELFIKTPNAPEECVARMDTRTHRMSVIRPKNQDNLLLCNHIFASLDNVDCMLFLSYDVCPKSQRKRVKLMLASKYSSTVRHTLWWVWKRETSPWLEKFEVPEL